MSRPGYIDTIYGRVPGCPDCGVIPLTGPHICEHGVTPAPTLELSMALEIADRALYDELLGPAAKHARADRIKRTDPRPPRATRR